jgi:hypothetical protein
MSKSEIILIILSLLTLIGIFFFFNIVDNGLDETCISEGWHGHTVKAEGPVCYHDIPHPSGTGTVREYSGKIG